MYFCIMSMGLMVNGLKIIDNKYLKLGLKLVLIQAKS